MIHKQTELCGIQKAAVKKVTMMIMDGSRHREQENLQVEVGGIYERKKSQMGRQTEKSKETNRQQTGQKLIKQKRSTKQRASIFSESTLFLMAVEISIK